MSEDFVNKIKDLSPQELKENFLNSYSGNFTEEENKKIGEAIDYLFLITKDVYRKTGIPYYLHPLSVAQITAEAKLDYITVISCLFHNIMNLDEKYIDEIEKRFGGEVSNICRGTAKITGLKINSSTNAQADSIRKMLFAMVDDIRVILVKLADRLDRMRNLKSVTPDAQKAVAKEVIDIWCPLASRLGMSDVKSEMEDLSLKYSNPEAFQQIKSIVSQKQQERSEYLSSAVKKIYSSTEKMGLHVNITSRAKHFYSIYQKMKKRNKEAGELYDLLALRIICNEVSECYTLIGVVHQLWHPMEGRFKDYIAMPKANGYQSLHTTVICEGKPLEIQIRTAQMHDVAEHGVASHWLYKKGTNKDKVQIEDLSIINQLRTLRDRDLSDEVFFSELKDELLGDSIYVFTPKGDVKELPQGANAIDFAYAIHSGVGEKVVGAKADGKIIPLTTPLKNTQIIEILTNPQAHPTQMQLKAVKTAKARQKIHSWLAENDPTFIDKNYVEKREAQIAANTLHSKLVAQTKAKEKKNKDFSLQYTGKVKVEGESNYVVTFAQCCKPKPGDLITGYMSHNRGIVIHCADCLTFLRIPNLENRKVSVDWEKKDSEKKD